MLGKATRIILIEIFFERILMNRLDLVMFPGNQFFQKERQYLNVGWGEELNYKFWNNCVKPIRIEGKILCCSYIINNQNFYCAFWQKKNQFFGNKKDSKCGTVIWHARNAHNNYNKMLISFFIRTQCIQKSRRILRVKNFRRSLQTAGILLFKLCSWQAIHLELKSKTKI